ncbi:MAG: flavin prenyltransferase UbiX [Syntrophobacteraceae bacterium]
MKKQNLTVAITGASGAAYARRLLQAIPRHRYDVWLVSSEAGRLVYEFETGLALSDDLPPDVRVYGESDFTAPIASGSFPCAGMVIVPCTMGTLGAIAAGLSQNLIHRAADVCLKERRPLILVPRETPLNRVHLANMLKAAEAGAIILPAMPGFYHKPRGIEDIVDFMVARILDQLGIEHNLVEPWTGLKGDA